MTYNLYTPTQTNLTAGRVGPSPRSRAWGGLLPSTSRPRRVDSRARGFECHAGNSTGHKSLRPPRPYRGGLIQEHHALGGLGRTDSFFFVTPPSPQKPSFLESSTLKAFHTRAAPKKGIDQVRYIDFWVVSYLFVYVIWCYYDQSDDIVEEYIWVYWRRSLQPK